MKYPIYKAKYPLKIKDNNIVETCFYTPLSKREINDLNLMFSENKTLFILNVLTTSLSDNSVIDYLSDKEVEDLYNEIIELSIPKKEDLELFEKLFNLTNDDILNSDTWDCEVCKERGLQESRACGFIDENKRDKTFQVYVAGEIFKICPIYYVLKYNELLQAGYEAYKYYRKGLMPESGGMYDQTMWFTELAIKMDNLVKKQQAEALEKDK